MDIGINFLQVWLLYLCFKRKWIGCADNGERFERISLSSENEASILPSLYAILPFMSWNEERISLPWENKFAGFMKFQYFLSSST